MREAFCILVSIVSGSEEIRWSHDEFTDGAIGQASGRHIASGRADLHPFKKNALGAYYRRMRSRLGAPKAITAAAHKLARLVYSMFRYGQEFVDQGERYYEQQYRVRVRRNLTRRAHELGLKLIPMNDLGTDANRDSGDG